MSHPRQNIRKKAAAMLLNQTDAGPRVATTALFPYETATLPAVSVYTLEESADDENTGPRRYRRELQLVVEAGAIAGDSIDDILDALALQMESAMAVDYTMGGLVRDCTYVGTEVEISVQARKHIGIVRVAYLVTYYTDLNDLAPVTPVDFITADIHTNLGNAQLTAGQAHDVVTDLED